MTCSYVFEIKPLLGEEEIKQSGQKICEKQFDVDVLKVGPFFHVFLDYAYGDSSEPPIVLKVVKYLQHAGSSGDVFYIRCYDAYDDAVPVHSDRLDPNDIFSQKYSPVMSIQENFKYHLKSL